MTKELLRDTRYVIETVASELRNFATRGVEIGAVPSEFGNLLARYSEVLTKAASVLEP